MDDLLEIYKKYKNKKGGINGRNPNIGNSKKDKSKKDKSTDKNKSDIMPRRSFRIKENAKSNKTEINNPKRKSYKSQVEVPIQSKVKTSPLKSIIKKTIKHKNTKNIIKHKNTKKVRIKTDTYTDTDRESEIESENSKKSNDIIFSTMVRNVSEIHDDINDFELDDINNLIFKLRDDLNLQLIDGYDYRCYNYIIELDNAIRGGNNNILNKIMCYDKYFKFYKKSTKNINELLKKKYLNNKKEYQIKKCYLDGYDIIHDVASLGGYIEQLNKIYKINDKQNNFNAITNNHKLSQAREIMVKELYQNIKNIHIPIDDDKVLNEMGGYATFFKEIYKIRNLKTRFTYRESGSHLKYYHIIKYYETLSSDKKEEFKHLCTHGDSSLINFYQQIISDSSLPPDVYYNFEIPKDAISAFDACGKNLDGQKISPIQTFKNVYSYYDYHILTRIIEIDYDMIPVHIVIVTKHGEIKANGKKNIKELRGCFFIQGEPSINFLVNQSNEIFKLEPGYTELKIPRARKKKVNQADQADQVDDREEEEDPGDLEWEEKDPGDLKEEGKNDDINPSAIPNINTSATTVFQKKKKTKKKPFLIINHKLKYDETEINLKDEPFFNNLKTDFKNIIEGILDVKINNKLIQTILGNLNPNGYYFNPENNWKENQLILFGNKTVGDLMFSCDNYKDRIKSLLTIDSFIKSSVLYNYLSGNSKALQSVWRRMKNKGWTYSKGIFETSASEVVKQVLKNVASILGFIKYYPVFEENKTVKVNNIHNLSTLRNNILNDMFELNGKHINIDILNYLHFNRIHNCLNYIKILSSEKSREKINTSINLNMSTIANMYNGLSYALLYHEIIYKYDMIKKYIEKLSSMKNLKNQYLIDSIKQLDKLSNIFYLNSISYYENNKSNIEEKQPKMQKLPRMSRKISSYYNIFNIDFNVENVIIKGAIQEIDNGRMVKKKANMINIDIVNNRKDTTKLIFNNEGGFHDNVYINNVNRIINRINIDETYIRELSENEFDDGIYYKVINNTLNYPTIEIITMSSGQFKVDTLKNKNILRLGKYNQDGRQIYISLWKVPNKIGNLFKLLEFNSIRHDYMSIFLIYTRIFTYFKYTLMNNTTYNEEEGNNIIINYIKQSNDNVISQIIKCMIELKKDEIHIYNKFLDLINRNIHSNVESDINILKDLSNINIELYDEFKTIITNDPPILTKIKNKINDEIEKCDQIIDNLLSTAPSEKNYLFDSNAMPVVDTNIYGGRNITRYIKEFYLQRNSRNKIIFDEPADDDEYNNYDDVEIGDTITYIPEVEYEEDYTVNAIKNPLPLVKEHLVEKSLFEEPLFAVKRKLDIVDFDSNPPSTSASYLFNFTNPNKRFRKEITRKNKYRNKIKEMSKKTRRNFKPSFSKAYNINVGNF